MLSPALFSYLSKISSTGCLTFFLQRESNLLVSQGVLRFVQELACHSPLEPNLRSLWKMPPPACGQRKGWKWKVLESSSHVLLRMFAYIHMFWRSALCFHMFPLAYPHPKTSLCKLWIVRRNYIRLIFSGKYLSPKTILADKVFFWEYANHESLQ